jgi:hypothetical protein
MEFEEVNELNLNLRKTTENHTNISNSLEDS